MFDAELHLPVVEVHAHTAQVRALTVINEEYVLSLSASSDGSIGMFRACARGRIAVGLLPPHPGSVCVYDRYGFRAAPQVNDDGVGSHKNSKSSGKPIEGGDALSPRSDEILSEVSE